MPPLLEILDPPLDHQKFTKLVAAFSIHNIIRYDSSDKNSGQFILCVCV